jgi:hypothetical protein
MVRNRALPISLLGADELSEPVLTGEFSEADQKTYRQSARGSILLNALILLAVMMIILSSIFESTILQVKMTANFKHDSEARIEAERHQQELENQLQKTEECHSPQCELIQFVPDAFLQWERTGVSYFRLKGQKQTTFAMRQRDQSAVPENRLPFEIRHFNGYTLMGSDPTHQGVRVYVTHQHDEHSVIETYQALSYSLPRLVYRIEEKTWLSVPTLWHGYLIVDMPLLNKVMRLDAQTGRKLEEVVTQAIEPAEDYECTLSPVVLVKAPIEPKRTIIISREKGFYTAAMNIDYERLGRRTSTF